MNINKDTTKNTKTMELLNILNNVDSLEKLEEYLDNTLKTVPELTVANYFQCICEDRKIKKSSLIQDANLSKSYFYQILNGEKNPSRDTIIKLSLALKLNLDETNTVLKIGKSSALYAKNQRDSIIIFAINKGYSVMDTDGALYNMGLDVLADYK